jgi:hypothetical protein
MSDHGGDPLGVGIYCTTGFPLRMRLCWGRENVEASLARRLAADNGSLASIGDDVNYGRNLASLVNQGFNPGDLSVEGSGIVNEVNKDPRVQTAAARVVLADDNSLQVEIEGDTSAGPFSLVIPVGDATADALEQGLSPTR